MNGAVPKLRFAGFTEAWRNTNAGSVYEFRNGLNFTRDMEGEEVRILGVSEFQRNEYFDEVESLPKVQIAEKLSDRDVLKENDLLFVRSNGNKALIGRCLHIGPMRAVASFSGFTIRGRSTSKSVDPAFGGRLFRGPKFRRYLDEMGGGTNISNLSQAILSDFTISIPSLPEQQKIASFLGAVDGKISGLRRKEAALVRFKAGLVQKLFSQKLRFTRDDGSAFPDWRSVALNEVLFEHKERSQGSEAVFSVSVHKGLVDQVEHLGRSFSAADTTHYNRVLPGDVVYTKSPTGDFPMGIIKQSSIKVPVIVSPLYGVFTPETRSLGTILNEYFNSPVNTSNYLSPLVQKGAKNTIAVTNSRFLEGRLTLPRDQEEQRKIADVLSAMDAKITAVRSQISKMETFKKGLLQQMFV